MTKKESKIKSFLQKLTDSFIKILPLNSSTKEESKPLLPVKNTRLASQAFGNLDDVEIKCKRAKLHHDPMSLPQSRILRVNTTTTLEKPQILNHFNDDASEFSEHSNASVSTSGVSSLNPHSSKRFNFSLLQSSSNDVTMKCAQNLNQSISNSFYQHSKQPLLLSDSFMSSPARKILDQLERITTPVSAGDKLSSTMLKTPQKSNVISSVKYQPYSRNIPSKNIQTPLPIKAVTVSASSNLPQCGPLRRKHTVKCRPKLGYYDDDNVDLDLYTPSNDVIAALSGNAKVNFSHMPLLQVSRSTSTDEHEIDETISPILQFDFSTPATVDESVPLHRYEFKRTVIASPKKDITQRDRVNTPASLGLWRCDTCFMENRINTIVCRGCSNLCKSNSDKVVLTDQTKSICIVNRTENSEISSAAGLSLVGNFNPVITSEKKESLSTSSMAFNTSFYTPDTPTMSLGGLTTKSLNLGLPLSAPSFVFGSDASDLSSIIVKSQPLNPGLPSSSQSLSFGLPVSASSFAFGSISGISSPQLPNVGFNLSSQSMNVTTPLLVSSAVFGAPISTPSMNFGASSSLPSLTFGVPSSTPSMAFGAPSSTPSMAFGAPSSTPSMAFGAPSSTPSMAFKAPSSTPSMTFGAPSSTPSMTFGAPSSTPSLTFGAPSSTPSLTFGAPSSTPSMTFGTPSSTPSLTFGAPSSTQSLTFGAPLLNSSMSIEGSSAPSFQEANANNQSAFVFGQAPKQDSAIPAFGSNAVQIPTFSSNFDFGSQIQENAAVFSFGAGGGGGANPFNGSQSVPGSMDKMANNRRFVKGRRRK